MKSPGLLFLKPGRVAERILISVLIASVSGLEPAAPHQERSLKTDDAETIDYALARSVQVLARRPFPNAAGIQTVIDELGKDAAGKSLWFEDYVDMRALRVLDKEGAFR